MRRLFTALCIGLYLLGVTPFPALAAEKFSIAAQENFQATQPLSRGEFAQWLLELRGFDRKNYKRETRVILQDIQPNSEFGPYIYALYEQGAFAFPSSKKFNQSKTITMKEALAWAFFVYGVPTPKIFPDEEWPFTYLKKKSDFAPLLHTALMLGLVDGQKKLYQSSKLTKVDGALFLQRLDGKMADIKNNTVTIRLESSPGGSSSISEEAKFPVMSDAYERIIKTYLHRDKISQDELLYGAISGMVKALDDKYSEFTKPTEESVVQTLEGNLEGIGAVIQADEEGNIVIVSPLKQSPAEAAGLLPHDIILEVNGEVLKGLTATKAAEKIRGPANTTVMLKIKRNGTTLDVSIIRKKIQLASAVIEFTADNIGIITMNNFGATLGIDFLKIVVEIAKKTPRGLILDLRNNPGGYLDMAIVVAGYFIGDEKVISKVRYPARLQEQKSSGTGVLAKYPLRVLINKGSASASEILAGALQDYNIGKIIGEKSFGKGTVQELTTYTDGSALKITVAEWLTPKERSIEKMGIAPDIEVARTADDAKNNRDPQMDRALADLRAL